MAQFDNLGLAYDAPQSGALLESAAATRGRGTGPPGPSTRRCPPLGTREAPPGTSILLSGWGFLVGEKVKISFIDSVHGSTVLTGRSPSVQYCSGSSSPFEDAVGGS